MEHVDKTAFSMWVPELARHFRREERSEVVIVGIESHICVTQTALDVLREGHRVYIVSARGNVGKVGVAANRE